MEEDGRGERRWHRFLLVGRKGRGEEGGLNEGC